LITVGLSGDEGSKTMSSFKKLTDESLDGELSAKGSQKVLVKVFGDNCPGCRVVDDVLERVEEELKPQAEIMEVNIDDSPGIADRLSIKAIPTLILFEGNKEIDRMLGPRYPDDIRSFIDRALGK
jgi:thioredoxin 2